MVPRSLLIALGLFGGLAGSLTAALALDAAPLDNPGPTARVSPGLLTPPVPLSEALREALLDRDHGEAARLLKEISISQLKGHAVDDHAFLLAWTLIRDGRAAEAAHLIPVIEKADHVPDAYKRLTLAELMLADDRAVEAVELLEEVPEYEMIWPRCALVQANALRELGRSAEARDIYKKLADRPDPAEGSALALLALAKLDGAESPEAYPLLRRAWTWYPTTDAGREAAQLLQRVPGKATWREAARRAEQLMEASDYSGAVALLEGYKAEVTEPDPDACLFWFVYGRSQFKKNNITLAADVMTPWGERCGPHDPEDGPKMLYLSGKAQDRKGAYGAAVGPYLKIAEIYPDSSFADDGLLLAGIAMQEAGDLDRAREIWARQVDLYPEGDMAGEGFWRLAWGSYLAGDPEGAIRWAEKMTWEMPLAADGRHWRAGVYWAARWRVYPDVDNPAVMSGDPEDLAEAIRLWRTLVEDHPFSYYPQLAAARLYELAPSVMDEITRPRLRTEDPWELREAFLDTPAVRAGIDLARLGLVNEALAEFGTLDEATLLPNEIIFIQETRWATDWLHAHEAMHTYVLYNAELGPQRDRIYRVSHPDLYWDEVSTAAKGYRYDPRIFHALVREESNFNRKAKSWAGAQGLSQLMPATARGVASRMGMAYSPSQVYDPLPNLKIGSYYLDTLFKRYNGNPFLSLAGYNAGEGNVDKWRREGERPTDEFVEAIPFRETRNYVKRVLGTYQAYRALYGDGPLFADWSAYNHETKPEL
jgi:soluble lytic murein transglycosylase